MFSAVLTSILLANIMSMSIEIPKFDMQETLEALNWCESRNRQWAVNRDDGIGDSYSYLQFKPETFKHFGKRYGLPFDDIFSKEQQFAIAEKMIEEGRGSIHWKNCWRKMKLFEI